MSVTRAALVLGLALVAPGAAGERPTPSPQAKPTPAPRSFTDDDLDRYRQEREAAKPATTGSHAPAVSEPAPGVSSEEEGSASEAETRLARYAELRNDLAAAEATRDETRARIGKIESLLNPMSTEFEVDPNAILRLQAELRDARARLDEQEDAVAQARAALEAFEDEARRAGVRLPPRD